MTGPDDKPPPAVGAYWIKEEDYPALLKIFDDGSKMPPTWQQWLKMAEEMERGLKAYGHPVMRVPLDPKTFPGLVRGERHQPRQRRPEELRRGGCSRTIRRSKLTVLFWIRTA